MVLTPGRGRAGALDDAGDGGVRIGGHGNLSRSASVTGMLSGSYGGSLRLRDPISGSFGGRAR
jgi:hypothetical protein